MDGDGLLVSFACAFVHPRNLLASSHPLLRLVTYSITRSYPGCWFTYLLPVPVPIQTRRETIIIFTDLTTTTTLLC